MTGTAIDYRWTEPIIDIGGPDQPPVRVLVSHFYYTPYKGSRKDDVDLDRWKRDNWPEGTTFDIFADSGGFSAHSLGAEVTLDKYAAWLLRWGEHFNVAVTLDAIRDPDTTYANWRELTARTERDILPVYHAGTDDNWRAFDRYLDEGVTYMALGGMVGQPASAVMRFVVAAHARAAGRCVFHGFGVTTWPIVSSLPWYSVDSSTWCEPMRFGNIGLFDNERGEWQKLSIPRRRGDHYPVTKREHDAVWEHVKLLRSYGVEPEQLLPTDDIDTDNWLSFVRTHANPLSTAAWRRSEQYLRERHGLVQRPGVPNDPDAGLRLYLVCVAVQPPGFSNRPIPGYWRGDTITRAKKHHGTGDHDARPKKEADDSPPDS